MKLSRGNRTVKGEWNCQGGIEPSWGNETVKWNRTVKGIGTFKGD